MELNKKENKNISPDDNMPFWQFLSIRYTAKIVGLLMALMVIKMLLMYFNIGFADVFGSKIQMIILIAVIVAIIEALSTYLKDRKEAKSNIGEFTLARQALTIVTLLEALNVHSGNTDKTEIARLIQMITGREIGSNRIQDTNIYKKHLSGIGKSEKNNEKDNLFVANYLQGVGLIDLAEKLRNSK